MIDSVRSTVLAALNKNNYGYLSPSDFNLYAKQAQLEIFENLFYQYNEQINLENVRRSGTDYANLTKGISEVIDLFLVNVSLTQVNANQNFYYMPSSATTGSDFYYINSISCYSNNVFLNEAEKVDSGKLDILNSSSLTKPSESFPIYVVTGDQLGVYPNTINGATDVLCKYVRYPKDPVWTYNSTLIGQAPIFNASAADYQDFELPKDYFNDLVTKILQYAGLEIREKMVVDFAKLDERENNIEQR
jgi:hypothetical protein